MLKKIIPVKITKTSGPFIYFLYKVHPDCGRCWWLWGALSHYLAHMGCEVPEIKLPMLHRWFEEIDIKFYKFLVTLLTGEKI